MYKLAIGETVKVPVKVDLNSDGKTKTFKFRLTCDRLSQDEVKKALEDEESKVHEFLTRVTKGWEDQMLVLGEDGKPAEFNSDSFELMLSVAGLAMVIGKSYFVECGAKGKN